MKESALRNARVILLHLPWLALLGWFSSVAWFLCDDAFISFRYVRNLLEGHGLVFNPRRTCRGLFQFPVGAGAGGDMGIVRCGAGASSAVAVGRLYRRHRRRDDVVDRTPAVAAPPGAGRMDGLGARVRQRHLRGVDLRRRTGDAAVHLLHRPGRDVPEPVQRQPPGPAGGVVEPGRCRLDAARRPAVGGVVLRLVRHSEDGGHRASESGLAAIALVGGALCRPGRRPFSCGATLITANGLPNTWYAKHVRPWYESGFRYLWAAALETGLYLLIPLAAVAMRSRWRASHDRIWALVLLLVGVHMAYVMRIGGDHFEYRPLDFYWPLLAVPASMGIVYLGSRIANRRWLRRLPPPPPPPPPPFGSGCANVRVRSLRTGVVLHQRNSGHPVIRGSRNTRTHREAAHRTR